MGARTDPNWVEGGARREPNCEEGGAKLFLLLWSRPLPTKLVEDPESLLFKVLNISTTALTLYKLTLTAGVLLIIPRVGN